MTIVLQIHNYTDYYTLPKQLLAQRRYLSVKKFTISSPLCLCLALVWRDVTVDVVQSTKNLCLLRLI